MDVHGIPASERPATADRLLLVSDLVTPRGWCVLNESVFVQVGESYWMDEWDLLIERLSGEVERRTTGFGDPATRPRMAKPVSHHGPIATVADVMARPRTSKVTGDQGDTLARVVEDDDA